MRNFRATNELGEKTARPFTEVKERRKEGLDSPHDGWDYVEPGSRSEEGCSPYVRRKVHLM